MGQETQPDSDSISIELPKGDGINIPNEESGKKHKCPYPDCRAAFLLASKLQRHERLHTGERPFRCQHKECTKSYTNSSHLKRHMETHSPTKKIYKCMVCSLEIGYFHNFKRHYKRVHLSSALSCDKCDQTFNKKHHLVRHQNQYHNSQIYKCDKCPRAFVNKSKLTKHQKSHEDKEYPCPVPDCPEVFAKWLLLLAHKREKHKTEPRCEICNKVFSNKFNLRKHRQIHSDDRKVLPCPYENCRRFYFFKSNLESHVRGKHLGKKFFCDTCSAGLSSKRRLITHIQRHQERESKPKEKSERSRRKRKDTGIPKRSALTRLIGLILPYRLEKLVMMREEIIANKLADPDVDNGRGGGV